MKERSYVSRLPDGSLDIGNGVIGPSLLDQQRSNFIKETKISPRKSSGKSTESRFGKTFLRIIPPGLAAAFLISACGGGSNAQELEKKESSGYSLPFLEGETWYLTTGPHGDGPFRIKNAIDIAPPELGRLNGNCPTDGSRLSIDNRVVTASASGEVIAKGDDKNRNDPHHSEIRIKDKKGFTQVYIHLDNTKVDLGDKVKQGTPLGNPSCEYPPGGANTGPHVHIGLMKDGQAISIDGAVVGGWTIHEGVNGQEGTMTKQGEKTRTANVGRYRENSTGIRNDLPNNPNRAVVASPKDPIPPISGSVKEKKVEETSPIPTPAQIEALKEKWQTFKSPVLPYEVQYPSSWKTESGKVGGESYDNFQDKDGSDSTLFLSVTSVPVDPKLTLDKYVNNDIEGYRKNWRDSLLDGKDLTVGVKKRLVDGLNGQIVRIDIPPNRTVNSGNGASFTRIFFLDGSQKLWVISYGYPKIASQTDIELILNRFLDNFKLVSSASVEKKVSLSKKPEELFRALLTNSIAPNLLPQGMSSGGTSAGEIDATGKAFKQVGAVNILIQDSVSTDVWKTPGNGKVFYGIFPDSSTAKSVSELIGTHLGNGQVLKEFPYPTKIYTTESSIGGVIFSVTTVLVTSVENITVATSLTGSDARGANTNLVQARAISLGHAAIKHLEKVGK